MSRGGRCQEWGECKEEKGETRGARNFSPEAGSSHTHRSRLFDQVNIDLFTSLSMSLALSSSSCSFFSIRLFVYRRVSVLPSWLNFECVYESERGATWGMARVWHAIPPTVQLLTLQTVYDSHRVAKRVNIFADSTADAYTGNISIACSSVRQHPRKQLSLCVYVSLLCYMQESMKG